MNLSRREFMQVLAAASASGMSLAAHGEGSSPKEAFAKLYDLPSHNKPGQVSFLHFTDCHAQLLPLHFREPSVNLGIGALKGKSPHLVGEALLKASGIPAGTAAAHAFTHLDFEVAARRFGKVGGFAHLATLIKHLRASRPGALLLDGGDTWQGSGAALWSNGQDMVDAALLLGVDIMTGHFEFTLGMERVQSIVKKDFLGKVEFLAQNIQTLDFNDPVFKPWVMRSINGVPCAVIGQAFPYTPVANPRYLVADWEFGIQDERMQKYVDAARAAGAQVVVVLSHNGMDVDLKMAQRVRGIDAILGGHTHDGVPVPVLVSNAGGKTLVTNAGSNGKFLGVLDFDVRAGKVADYRYRLLPIFAAALPADPQMQALITQTRLPYAAKLSEKLAVTDSLLYRRGNFNGSGDQLLLDALIDVQDAEIAFSPGFRWGTTLLPGEAITREWLMDMTATSYSWATVTPMTGATIKTILEDVADNIFNPDPYYQQGGDMVRIGGLSWTCTPSASFGKRISNMRLSGGSKGGQDGALLAADKTYKVAGWAPVSEEAKNQKLPQVWDVVETWLKSRPGGRVTARKPNIPQLEGVLPNPGWASQA